MIWLIHGPNELSSDGAMTTSARGVKQLLKARFAILIAISQAVLAIDELVAVVAKEAAFVVAFTTG